MPRNIICTSISLLLALTVIVSAWVESAAFMEESTMPKWIYFSFGTSLLLLVSSILFLFDKGRIKIGKFDATLLVIFCIMFGYIFIRSKMYQDIYVFIIFILFYFAIKLLYYKIPVLNFFAILFIICASISFFIGIGQLMNDEKLTGPYGSIVGFVITLVLGCLSVIHILKSSRNMSKISCFGLLIVEMAFLAMILFSNSRVGILSLGLGSLYFIRKHKYCYLIPIVLFVISLSLLNFDKSESTKGRLFILKTTVELLDSPEKILFGYGEDGFISNYMSQQSENLVKQSEEIKQRAANIIHPLNEFLLLIVKYGVLIIITIIIICVIVLNNKGITPYAKSIIISLLVLSMFSYPFRYPISWIALAVALASCPDEKTPMNYSISATSMVFMAVVGSIIGLSFTFKTNYDLRLWKKAHVNAMLGRNDLSLNQYQELDSRFNSPEFRYNYSSYLCNLGKYREALAQLQKCYLIDYETILLSARIYGEVGDDNKAISYYSKAYSMCPNRFVPLFEIYKIHKKRSNRSAQSHYANIILKKRVKIPSDQIDYILQTIKTDKEKLRYEKEI